MYCIFLFMIYYGIHVNDYLKPCFDQKIICAALFVDEWELVDSVW